MAKKKQNHHLYQDNGVWYFQKKVKGFSKPYKFSLETTSVTEARRKRDEYLKEIEYHGYLPSAEPEKPENLNAGKVFGEVAKLCCQLDYVARNLLLSIWIRQFDSNNFIEFHFILLIPFPPAFFSYSA